MTPGAFFLLALEWFGVGAACLVMLVILAALASLLFYIGRTVIRGVNTVDVKVTPTAADLRGSMSAEWPKMGEQVRGRNR